MEREEVQSRRVIRREGGSPNRRAKRSARASEAVKEAPETATSQQRPQTANQARAQLEALFQKSEPHKKAAKASPRADSRSKPAPVRPRLTPLVERTGADLGLNTRARPSAEAAKSSLAKELAEFQRSKRRRST